jgi:hypothetical protein
VTRMLLAELREQLVALHEVLPRNNLVLAKGL